MNCTVTSCPRAYYSKGFCKKHYDANRRHGNPTYAREVITGVPCTVEPCSAPVWAKGCCQKHYRQMQRATKQGQRRKDRAYTRKYKKTNLAQTRADVKARGKRVKQATPPWVDVVAIKNLYLTCPEGLSLDHIIPITHKEVCGLHVPWNLQPLTQAENSSKKNKFDGTYDNESWRRAG